MTRAKRAEIKWGRKFLGLQYKINQKTPTRSWSEWCSKSSNPTADLLRRFPAQLFLTLSDDGLQVWTSVQVLRCHTSEQFPQFQTNLLAGFSIVFCGIEQGHPKGKQVGLSRNQRKLETRGKNLQSLSTGNSIVSLYQLTEVACTGAKYLIKAI